MKLFKEDGLALLILLILLPAVATAFGIPALLLFKISRGASWGNSFVAMALYVGGWAVLALLASRFNRSMPLWSLVASLLLLSSVLVAIRLPISPAGSPDPAPELARSGKFPQAMPIKTETDSPIIALTNKFNLAGKTDPAF